MLKYFCIITLLLLLFSLPKTIAASRAKQDALNKVSSVVRESMGNKESRSKSKGEEEEEEKSRKEDHYNSNQEEEEYKYEFD